MTVSTRVCCSIDSESQIRYGSRVRRQGRSRRTRAYHAASATWIEPIASGASSASGGRRGGRRSGRLRDFGREGSELGFEVFLDPALVKPLRRIDEGARGQHREVQMVATGEAGRTRAAERLALRDGLALFDGDLGEMSVQAEESHAVVDEDHAPVDAELVREHDHA